MKPVLNYIFEVYYELTHNTTFQPRSKKVTTKSAVFDPETELLNVEIEYL